jgi:hypothetical protein
VSLCLPVKGDRTLPENTTYYYQFPERANCSQKESRYMKKLTSLARLTLVAGLFLAGSSSAFATVALTGASGGGIISADTAANGLAPAWTTLGPVTITEGASTDFTNGTGVTLILKAPAGFQFNTAVTPNVTFTASKNITSAFATMTDASTITITLTVSGTAVSGDSLTIGSTTGIQVRPTASTPLARAITFTGPAPVAGPPASGASRIPLTAPPVAILVI